KGASVNGAPTHSGNVSAAGSDVGGRLGTDVSLAANVNAPVRSPTVCLRHAVSLGSEIPGLPFAAKTRSRKRICDVWSSTSGHTNGRHPGSERAPALRLHGEITSIGTRKPRPTGL